MILANKKIFLLFLFFITTIGISFAQNKEISGSVKDAKGLPIPAVTVLIKGSNKGTQTDFNGQFKLQAKANDVLRFSFIGYQSRKFKMGNSNYLSVILEEETQKLDEVVVMGYGSAKSIKQTVGTVTKISSKEFANHPTTNVLDALQGKVVGLQVSTQSGEPSAPPSLRLYGVGSVIGDIAPLFVVDGIPISQIGFRSLNSEDFESITVLKDASATSIYGARAANGVVYVTTKKGAFGKRQVSVSTQYGVSSIADKSGFERMMTSAELAKFQIETEQKTQEEMDEFLKEYNADTKWYKVFFRENTSVMRTNVSVRGGSEKINYFVSGGYSKNKGIMYNSFFERYNFRSNIDSKVNNWLKLGVNASINYSLFAENPFNRHNDEGTLGYTLAPFYSPVDKNGKRYNYIPGLNKYHPEYRSETLFNDNLLLLTHANNENKTATETSSFNIMKSVFGRLEYNYNQKYFFDASFRRDGSSKFSPNNKYGNFWATGFMWRIKQENFLKNNNTINDLGIKLSVGTQGASEIGDYTHFALVTKSQYGRQNTWTLSGTQAGNPELTWENQTKYSIGIDARLFNTLSIDLELYNRITSDLLMTVNSPYTTGFGFIQNNAGSIQNRSIGATISFDAYKSENWFVSPYLSFTYNEDKVLKIFNGRNQFPISGQGYSLIVGKSMNYYFPLLKGVNSQTGLNEWYLPSEDTSISTRDDNRVTSEYSEKLYQNTGHRLNAPFNGGFGLSLRYKNISLQTDFAFSYGKYVINHDKFFTQNPTIFSEDNFYWKKPGDVTKFPKFGEQFTQFDLGLIENSSFLRMKTISLGYSIPQSVLLKTNFFTKVRFYVTGRNLLTWTKFTGADPERTKPRSLGVYPNSKEYVFGVELNF